MGRFTRGPLIPDMDTLRFCLEHGDHVYHGTSILPACQLKTWSWNRLEDRIKNQRLHFAELRVDA